MVQAPKGFSEFEEDSRWFYEHISLLRKENLTGKFVAIKSKQIIASDTEVANVVKAVEGQGENPAYIVIEFVYPESTVILL